jgi:hypothetical protein
MVARTTIRLPEHLLRRAKRKAAAEGRTLTSLIAEGLRLVVTEARKGAKPKPVMPRVSKARGGLVPAMQLSEISVLQDTDDLDYVSRLRHLK